jgi:hypothetical protein
MRNVKLWNEAGTWAGVLRIMLNRLVLGALAVLTVAMLLACNAEKDCHGGVARHSPLKIQHTEMSAYPKAGEIHGQLRFP